MNRNLKTALAWSAGVVVYGFAIEVAHQYRIKKMKRAGANRRGVELNTLPVDEAIEVGQTFNEIVKDF